jgi:hypothetical protein
VELLVNFVVHAAVPSGQRMRRVDLERPKLESTEAEHLVFVVHGFVAEMEKRNVFLLVILRLARFEYC